MTRYVFSPLVYDILINEDYAHLFQNFQLKFSDICWIWGLFFFDQFWHFFIILSLNNGLSSVLFLLSSWSAHGMRAQPLSSFQLFVTLWTVAHQLLSLRDSPGQHTGGGCCVLLRGILLMEGWNPHLLRLLPCGGFPCHCTVWEDPERSSDTCPIILLYPPFSLNALYAFHAFNSLGCILDDFFGAKAE